MWPYLTKKEIYSLKALRRGITREKQRSKNKKCAIEWLLFSLSNENMAHLWLTDRIGICAAAASSKREREWEKRCQVIITISPCMVLSGNKEKNKKNINRVHDEREMIMLISLLFFLFPSSFSFSFNLLTNVYDWLSEPTCGWQNTECLLFLSVSWSSEECLKLTKNYQTTEKILLNIFYSPIISLTT